MMTRRSGILASITAVALAGPVCTPDTYGAVIAQYTYAGMSTGLQPSAPPSTVGDDVAVTDMTTGGGITGALFRINVSSAAYHSSNRSLFENAAHAGTTLQDAISRNAYWVFSAVADPGFVLNLDSLSFAMGGGGSGTSELQYHVLTSVDGFTAADAVDFGSVTGNAGTTAASWTIKDVDLTASRFQGLSNIEVRIYAVRPPGENLNQFIRLDTVTLNGDVIPEPASLALLGIGAAMMIGRRRRA
jgi:hypothetical protein